MTAEDIDLGSEQVAAMPGDASAIADITADAFRADPFNLWLFGNFAGIRSLFALQARHIYVPRGFSYRLGDQGACMWMLPGGDASFRFWDYVRFAVPTALLCGPGAVKRGIRTGEAMEAAHPQFPHAYLFSIGTRAASRGKGLGRRLIRPVLETCDRMAMPAYLENSNPANTGFYRSCGFEQYGEPIHPEPDSPPLVPMLRLPRTP